MEVINNIMIQALPMCSFRLDPGLDPLLGEREIRTSRVQTLVESNQ